MNLRFRPRMRSGLTAPLVALVMTGATFYALPLRAQEAARNRAEQTLPPEVFQGVLAVAEEAAVEGVPPGPLFNKALEGAAKRVPADRLLPAVRAYAGRLGEARAALGADAGVPLLVAGADAIQRGVPADALRDLPRDRPRSPVALLVLAELMESGVPRERAIATLRQTMDQRVRDDAMLEIPARVRRLIRDGVPPAEAIERVRRTISARRGGTLLPALPPGDRPTADRQPRARRRPGGW